MSGFLDLARSLILRSTNDFDQLSTLQIDFKRMVLGLPGDLTLGTFRRAGTPLSLPSNAGNTTSLKLEKPVVTYRDGQLRGRARLTLPDSSGPPQLTEPLSIDVSVDSVDVSVSDAPLVLRVGGGNSRFAYDVAASGNVLPEVSLRGSAKTLGILTTDWKLKIGFDSRRLSSAMQGVIDRRGSGSALTNLKAEVTHPGFDLSTITRATIPFIGALPISSLRLQAPTTRPVRQPLMGAMMSHPYNFRAFGLVPTPPGTLFDFWAAGAGYSSSNYDAQSGSNFNVAVLPTISVDGKSMLEKFPVYAYLEYSQVHRVSDGLELGFRFTLAPSSVDIARLAGSTSADQDRLLEFRSVVQEQESFAQTKGMAMFDVIGRFR